MAKPIAPERPFRKRQRPRLAGLILLSLALSLGPLTDNALVRAAQPLPSIRLFIDLPTTSPRVGDIFTIEARVEGAPALAGVALRLQYDTARLRAVGTSPGEQISHGGFFTPTVVLTSTIDSSAGLITFDGVRAAPFPSGDGALIRVTFAAQQEGSANIAWQPPGTVLVTPDGLRVPVQLEDALVSILPPVTCRDVIANGSFEATSAAPWQVEGGALIYRLLGHDSQSSAWLGGYDNADDAIWQSVSIPADAASARLRYWLYVQTEATAGQVPDSNDVLLAEVRDDAGALLQILATHDGTDLGVVEPPGLDLIAYAGETVRVRFWATCDAHQFTSFFVDDVSLDVCRTGDWPNENNLYLPLVVREE